MDKLAMIKTAETIGVVASLQDAGLVSLSDSDFDACVTKTAELLPESWDLPIMLEKIAEAISTLGVDELEKDAEEIDMDAATQAMGELTLAKLAGEISDEDFAKEAGALSDLLAKGRAVAGKAGEAVGKAGERLRGSMSKAQAGEAAGKVSEKALALRSSGKGKAIAAGAAAAAGGGLGYALYNKAKKKKSEKA